MRADVVMALFHRMRPFDSRHQYLFAQAVATQLVSVLGAASREPVIGSVERRPCARSRIVRFAALLVAFTYAGVQGVQAQSNGNIGGFDEVSTSNPYPYSSLTFIGTNGHIRALADLDLGSQVQTEANAVARLSATTGHTMSVTLDWLRQGTTLYLGSATDTGTINVLKWTARWNNPTDLVIDGGTVFASPLSVYGLQDLMGVIRSVTINNNARLELSSKATRIRRLEGGGSIGIFAPLTIDGGTFSTSITGASRLIFTGDSTWTGTGGSIGTLEVVPGVTLTTSNSAAVESSTDLQIDGTHQLNASLSVNGLSGSGLIVLGPGVSLSAGSQNASSVFSGSISGTGGIVKDGTGRQTLTGINTYTGGTTVNAGTLALSGLGSLAASGSLNLRTPAETPPLPSRKSRKSAVLRTFLTSLKITPSPAHRTSSRFF